MIKHASEITALATMMVAAQTAKTPTFGKNANFIRKVKRLYARAEERTAHPKQLSTDCQIR